MKNINKTITEYHTLLKQLLDSQGFTLKELNRDYKRNITYSKHNVKGVYVLMDETDNIVYSGKTDTKTILDRVGKQHVYGGASSDLRDLLGRPPLEELYRYKCKYIRIDDETPFGS